MKSFAVLKPSLLGTLIIVSIPSYANVTDNMLIAKNMQTAKLKTANNNTAKLDSDIARLDEKKLAKNKLAKTDLAKKISDDLALNRKTARRNELFVSLYGEQFAEELEGIPEEFLQIVHNQTFSVQLILAGQDVGHATLSVSPNKSALSDIMLNSSHKEYFKDDFDDGKLVALLESENLFTGIECDEFKAQGVSCNPDEVLLKAVFDNENLNLYLYVTSDLLRDEGISLVNAHFLPPPTTDDVTSILGYQLNTSASEYSNQYNLRLKGVVGKGAHNVIANTRLSNENSQLDDMYYRYDMNGAGAKAGLLSTEKLGNDAGFSQSLLDTRQDLVGFEYGASNKTLITDTSSSIIPVEIVMSRTGRVEVYKDSELIDTQYVDSGIARLNTQSFPYGNYLVDVRIYDGDKFVRSEKKQVIKEQSDFSNKYTVFGGYKFDRERDGEQAHKDNGTPMIGGMYQVPIGKASALSLSTKLDPKKSQIGADFKQTLPWFNYSVKTAFNTDNDSAITGYVNKSWGNYTTYLNYRKNDYGLQKQADKYARNQNSETASFSLARTFYHGRSTSAINLFGNYDIAKDQFESGRLSYRTELDFWEIGLHDVRVETGFNYGKYTNSRNPRFEESIDLRVTIPLNFGTNKRLNISTNYDHTKGAELVADYHQTFDNSAIKYAAVNASIDDNSSQLTGRTGFETNYVRGDVGATLTNYSTSGYTNLNGTVGVSSDGVGMGNNSSAESGVIVTVNPEAVGNVDLVSETDRYPIITSPQFIPLQAMKEHNLEFDNTRGTSADNFNIKRGKQRFVAYSGNVLNLNAEFYKTAAVFGQLVGTNGKVLQYVKIKSKEKTTFTDESGQFSIEPFDNETLLTIEHEDGQTETITIGELNKPVNFIGRKQVKHKSA